LSDERTIRPATAEDAPAIAAIWNPVIRDSTITFTTEEKTPEAVANQIAEAPAFLVLETSSHVTGFATFGAFRKGPGYRHSAEHTIILAPETHGQGHAAALLAALEDQARNHDIHVLVAGISGENPRAIRFHAAQGYTETARMPEVGRKFGQWLDLVLMQKQL
jgi:L-amino acid N-acyltransferase